VAAHRVGLQLIDADLYDGTAGWGGEVLFHLAPIVFFSPYSILLGVVRAFDMSQKTFRRILLNLFWASIYNILGIPIAAGVFVGLGLTLNPELAGLAMALSSLSVLTSSLLLNVEKID